MHRAEVLARLRERVVSFAASHISRDVAEDLAEEVLIVLEEKYADVERIEELVPLCLQIMRLKITGLRRIRDSSADPETYEQRQELLQRLNEAIPRLGERCREILRLKLLGKSFAEIQEALDAASIDTAYTSDARCRKNLLDLLGGKWERGQ